MERIIKDFRIANNLPPMESIQQLNRPGGLWWYSDLLPLGGNLSLALLIEIVPRQSNLNTIAVCLQPFLVLKSRRCKCRPYFAPIQDVVFISLKVT